MEKIMDLTREQFEEFEKSKNPIKFAKELLDITTKAKLGVGDTAALISNTTPLEVYKKSFNDGTFTYYIVIEPMDERAAMCYTIYHK